MKKILLLTLLGLGCCTTAQRENDFTKYLDLLPIVSLPFETNCEKCCDHPIIDYDNALISKFKPEGSALVGLVNRTENRALVLVTYPADMTIPSLKVYDLEGNLTGEMTFMTSYCGGDPGFESRQFFRISENI